MLVELIERAAAEPSVDALADDAILALCDAQMEEAQQEELSDLLAASREGILAADRRGRLDELMNGYRRGLVRKAQALQVAVKRGLRPPLR